MADLTGATPQMIGTALVDPFASNGDTYQYSKNGKYYAVWSVGLDGTSATADIDASGNVLPVGDDIALTNGTIGADGGTPPGSVADGNLCTDPADCVSGTCTSGSCEASGGGQTGNWGQCASSADCQAGRCLNFSGVQYCSDGLNGSVCTSTSNNCQNGLSCIQYMLGYYVCGDGLNQSSCASASDCSGGRACIYQAL